VGAVHPRRLRRGHRPAHLDHGRAAAGLGTRVGAQRGRPRRGRRRTAAGPAPAPERAMSAPVERVLVVIPTYNEAENLPRILDRLRAGVPDAHALIVDDG